MEKKDISESMSFKIDDNDIYGKILWTDEVIKHTKIEIFKLMDLLIDFLKEEYIFEIERFYDEGYGTHKRGLSCDFRIKEKDSNNQHYFVKILAIETFLNKNPEYCKITGLGIYPLEQSFHLEVRETKGRWAGIGDNEYLDYYNIRDTERKKMLEDLEVRG